MDCRALTSEMELSHRQKSNRAHVRIMQYSEIMNEKFPFSIPLKCVSLQFSDSG